MEHCRNRTVSLNGHSTNGVPPITDRRQLSPRRTAIRRSSPKFSQQRMVGRNPNCITSALARKREGLWCDVSRSAQQDGRRSARAEDERADILSRELYRWRKCSVPFEELLRESQDALSPRVRLRAQMLRIMKTARGFARQARTQGEALAGRRLDRSVGRNHAGAERSRSLARRRPSPHGGRAWPHCRTSRAR